MAIEKKSALATFIKQRRKQSKITQEIFAQKAGVGLRFLRELESGKETARMDKVNDVLKMFGHTLGAVPMDRNELLNNE
jgi:y4mF family transcriptional regulator